MEKWNVTEYRGGADSIPFYYCKAFIRNGYYIANGDERFYSFMGKNTCYSIPELLHPEDVELFLEAVSRLDEEPQSLIARMKGGNNVYRCLYMVLTYNEKMFEGFRSFTMELCEIASITERYKVYGDLVDKYREFMTMFQGSFFEYDFMSDEFLIYEYRNSQSKVLCRDSLERIYEQIQKRETLSCEQKAEFEVFYEAVKKGRDHFTFKLDASVLFEQEQKTRYEIKGSTIYKEDIRNKVIGVITVISGEQPKKSYYLSENAYDVATGLLNKRAIHEYAVEKISTQKQGIYLAVMDVDDFKRINDSFGHLYGDEVLSKVSEIIRSVLHFRGVAGRFGGDEFMILFEEIDSEDTLRRILTTISKHIQWAFNGVEGLSVTTSMGIAKCPEDGVTYDELFHKADKCLYIAKAKGKNRYIIYDREKHGELQDENTGKKEIGLKVNISDEEKSALVSEIVLRLHKEGYEALQSVLEQVRTYFDIDGIAVYAGRSLQRVLEVGKYVNPIERLDFVADKVYQEYLDEQGFYIEGQLSKLKNKLPIAYELYTKQETHRVMQCILSEQGQPTAVISFDFFNRSPKYGTMDTGLLKIVGRLMAEVAAEEKK